MLHFDAPDDGPPLLSLFGGEFTTARGLEEAASARLSNPSFPRSRAAHLGADFNERELVRVMREEWPATTADVSWRRSELGLRPTSEEMREGDGVLAGMRPEPVKAAIDAIERTC
ncbi:MAG: hypothetical protein RMJ04_15265 [Geminicoccaceae bacterium]|nr:hypothetical protein [Geminicoccaceae bacterium]